ncbi:MAG: hypothetical protein ACOY30_00490 [Bacillota bacterium]
MNNLTLELKELARGLGAADIGAAPADRYHNAPEGHRPEDFLPGAVSVITFTYKINKGPLNNLPRTRNQYMVEFEAANQILLQMSHKIARFLEEKGYESSAFGPEASIGDYSRLKGDFSHKHSAVLCGLGHFGINNLLITPQHRTGVRLASVATTATLDYAPPSPSKYCEECLQCVHTCPSGALDGWEGNYDPLTGWTISKEKCAHYMFVTSQAKRCGICVKACLDKA